MGGGGFVEGFSLGLVCGLRCPAECGNLSSLTMDWTPSPAVEGRFLTPGPPASPLVLMNLILSLPKLCCEGKKRIHKWVSCPISAKYKQWVRDQKQASFCPSWLWTHPGRTNPSPDARWKDHSIWSAFWEDLRLIRISLIPPGTNMSVKNLNRLFHSRL